MDDLAHRVAARSLVSQTKVNEEFMERSRDYEEAAKKLASLASAARDRQLKSVLGAYVNELRETAASWKKRAEEGQDY